MIVHPPNGRAYLVPRAIEGSDLMLHLWNCYIHFKELVSSEKFDDDLVFMWRKDYEELYKNYNPREKK